MIIILSGGTTLLTLPIHTEKWKFGFIVSTLDAHCITLLVIFFGIENHTAGLPHQGVLI